MQREIQKRESMKEKHKVREMGSKGSQKAVTWEAIDKQQQTNNH